MYEEILLPTDGSPGSEAAVDHAMHIATQNNAVVHVMHVIEITELGDIPVNSKNIESDLYDEALELLTPIIDAADEAGVETQKSVVEGRAHEKLIEYVEDRDIDMVVMGTHGKSGLSRVLLGSTAEKVVRHSSAPVLTIQAPVG